MKILMYAPIFPPAIGGPATQSHSLCGALLARDITPVVVTPGTQYDVTSPEGYLVYRYPWEFIWPPLDRLLRWTLFPFYFTRILHTEKPDIIHCHSVSALSFVVAVIARLYRIPTIVKFAGDWVWETLSTPRVRGREYADVYTSSLLARLLTAIERFGLSRFSIVWVVSNYRIGNVRKLLGSDEKIRRIPNSLILPPGGWTAKKEGDTPIVISANRFIPHKRLPMLVRAFAHTGHSSAKLILIGGGEERMIEEVRTEIRRQGLEGRVTLTGIISPEEIYAHFKKATIYVSTSLEEGLPNVFIEAMHFGLPIVTTDVGGCREMVFDGKTGFLVDAMDEEMLTTRMKTLMENPTLRNQYAEAAYASSSQYDLTVVVDKFIDLYTSLLSKK